MRPLLIALFFTAGLCAAEPPIKDGLILSLDATMVSGQGRPIDRWGSARQILASARPVTQSDDEEAFVRFDGKDDFLAVSGEPRSASAMTVFILASVRSNPGFFSALFSCAPAGANDYIGGLNIDLGPASTTNLSVVNVESAGSGGFVDLLQPGWVSVGQAPFGGFHLFTVRSQAGPKGTELFLDGMIAGARARSESKIGLNEMVIGGRLYSNDPAQPPFAQGFFHGDISAVLVYDRALTDGEREKVEQTLFTRVPKLNALASGQRGHALEMLSNPPVIQMLAPGFTVHEMPIKISNINNVRYRPDGKLLALGYDGRLHLLSDTDGDGLEDKDEIFWDKSSLRAPMGVAFLPAGDPRGDGVFVPSKGKLSLILDRDRDGQADEEIVVATGWKESTHGVDALGVAVDPKDGSIYFSLGCENFVDAYVRDANGKSHYQLSSERGTVMRVAKDFSKREIVCTGVRFLCGMAFNGEGDLFATDQEGATWLPNGNPLDELLQIVPGRHYGFPPRHPKHLPNVTDEPPLMEYGPQHQSTVGLIFNEGVNGGPAFGPKLWEGDGIICGESRGKIYRTKLVKTSAGYIADNQLIACLQMLTVDSCVSPKGELVVSCHSGPPDWGTGPAGEGRLFKIRYARPETPQVARTWASSPDEFKIAFDKPLLASDWAGAREKIHIEAGKYVNAGDRYETIRPGYQVVRDQMAAPRRWVEVQSVSISADQRTLILRIPRQTEAVTYAVTLPTPKSWSARGGIEQRAEMDVTITLNGIEAKSGDQRMILPHPSLEVARALTAGSAEHEAFFKNKLDAIELRGGVDDSNIFVPATQPGATLDWDIAHDAFANRRMKVGGKELPEGERIKPVWFSKQSEVNFAMDDKVRPIPTRRLFVPWAREKMEEMKIAARTDVKGNWLGGRRLFFGAATCSTCHTIRGEGTLFGPDLSNLVFRDRESVMNDIAQPSSTINPDHTGSVIKLADASEVNGLVKTLNDEKLVVRLAGGIEQEHPRKDVRSIEPMKKSLMPDGLAGAMSKEQLEDLMTFLLTNPLEPTKITRLDPPIPAARTRAEIAPFLTAPDRDSSKPLRILLCSGPKDHGVDEHDYPVWLDRWSKLLALADNVTIATHSGFTSAGQLAKCDVAVFYSANPGWDGSAAKVLDEFQKRGGGLVYLHYGIEGGKDPMGLAERVGLAFYASAFRHGPMELIFNDTAHPITQGFSRIKFLDESYWALKGDPKRVHDLADSVEDGQPRPQLWTMEREKGRVFVCIPGHYMWTFDDPLYRVLVLRGIAWAAGEADVNRFNELALIGARVAQ
jgi:putative heme-binding domain-containing protein